MTGKRLLFAALLALTVLPAGAQESGLAFLRLGTNAAAMGLGDAHVALSRDAFSAFWNPAGLSGGGDGSAAATHHIWAGDVRGYTIVARLGVGRRGGAGFFTSGFTSETEFGGSEIPGAADNRSVTAGAAYGHRFGPVRAGVTLRYLSERYGSLSANGFAGDAGVQVDLWSGAVRLGGAVQHVGRMSSEGGLDTRTPRTMRAGAVVFPFRVMAEEDGSRLLDVFATADLARSRRTSPGLTENASRDVTQLHLGLGAEVLEVVTVRTGYVTDDQLRGLSVGVGLRYESLQLDHAFVPFGDGYGAGHVLTLSYGW